MRGVFGSTDLRRAFGDDSGVPKLLNYDATVRPNVTNSQNSPSHSRMPLPKAVPEPAGVCGSFRLTVVHFDTEMQAFNRANRMNEVGDLKRETFRPPTESAQIMYFLCTPEAADLNGQIINARDSLVCCAAPREKSHRVALLGEEARCRLAYAPTRAGDQNRCRMVGH